MLREHVERQFPDDAAFGVGEAVELVHHHRGDLREVEAFGMQQPVQENLGDDDEDARVRVDLAVAGDEADVIGLEAPAHGGGLHLGELLLGQCDQRRRVVGDGVRVQRLEQRRLGDQRLAGAGRCTDQHALFGREPREQCFFLHRVRRVGELLEILHREFGTLLGQGHDAGLV